MNPKYMLFWKFEKEFGEHNFRHQNDQHAVEAETDHFCTISHALRLLDDVLLPSQVTRQVLHLKRKVLKIMFYLITFQILSYVTSIHSSGYSPEVEETWFSFPRIQLSLIHITARRQRQFPVVRDPQTLVLSLFIPVCLGHS